MFGGVGSINKPSVRRYGYFLKQIIANKTFMSGCF